MLALSLPGSPRQYLTLVALLGQKVTNSRKPDIHAKMALCHE